MLPSSRKATRSAWRRSTRIESLNLVCATLWQSGSSIASLRELSWTRLRFWSLWVCSKVRAVLKSGATSKQWVTTLYLRATLISCRKLFPSLWLATRFGLLHPSSASLSSLSTDELCFWASSVFYGESTWVWWLHGSRSFAMLYELSWSRAKRRPSLACCIFHVCARRKKPLLAEIVW